MFVEQQMKLVERGTPHQPVMLLVQGVENLRVGENPVQPLAGIEPRVARKPERKEADGAKFLDFRAMLVQPRLAERGVAGRDAGWRLAGHDAFLSRAIELAARMAAQVNPVICVNAIVKSVRGYVGWRVFDRGIGEIGCPWTFERL
jgi:hypothetical protein